MPRRLCFDANASTPLLPAAAEAVTRVGVEAWGNPSSAHEEGRRARAALDAARDRVAAGLACRPREIVFTSGATEALHLAVLGAARARLNVGRRVVVSAVEHPAVLDAADRLAEEGFEVVRVPPRPDGAVDPDVFVAAATPGTIVACLMAANHETGAVMPVAAVAAALRGRGVVTVTDAALAPGLLDVGVDALGADLIAFSGHKIGGPRGIGALFVRRKTRLAPPSAAASRRTAAGRTENVAGAAGSPWRLTTPSARGRNGCRASSPSGAASSRACSRSPARRSWERRRGDFRAPPTARSTAARARPCS
jgi:cysteine desulfurase